MPVVRNLLWNRPRKMRRWDRSSSVELLWSHYVRGILLWSGQRKLRSLLRSKTVHTRGDRSSSVELLWSRLRKMRGWLRSKIEKKALTNYLLNGPPRAQQFFEAPAPTLPREKKLSLLKSLPQEISLTRSAKVENWNPGPASNFSLQNLPSWRRKKICPNKFAIEKEMIEIFALAISGKFA